MNWMAIILPLLAMASTEFRPPLTSADYVESAALSASYFAAAAYCTADDIAAWNCGIPCEQHSGFAVDKVLYTTVFGNTNQVFLGYERSTSTYVISFEGIHNT